MPPTTKQVRSAHKIARAVLVAAALSALAAATACSSDGSNISAAEHACNVMAIGPTPAEAREAILEAFKDGATPEELRDRCGAEIDSVLGTLP